MKTFTIKLVPSKVKLLKKPTAEEKVFIYFKDTFKRFGVRVTSSGTISYIVRYQNGVTKLNKPKYSIYTIARHDEMIFEDAEAEAYDIIKHQSKTNETPQEQIKSFEDHLFQTVANNYLEHVSLHKNRERTYENNKELLGLHRPIMQNFYNCDIETITKKQIKAFHLAHSHIPTQANRMLSLLSVIFNYAVNDLEIIPFNPCKGVTKYKENKNMHFLNEEEIEIFKSIAKESNDTSGSNAILILFNTGCRVGELLKATWDEINFKERVWYKPAAHTKQKKAHKINLNEEAFEAFTNLYEGRVDNKKINPNGYIFFNKRTGTHQLKIGKVWETTKDYVAWFLWFIENETNYTMKNYEALFKANRMDFKRTILELRAGAYLTEKVTHKNISRLYSEYQSKCALPTDEDIKSHKVIETRVHDIRHSVGSKLIKNGVPLPVVSKIFGHAKVSTTADIYIHSTDEDVKNAVDKL